MLKLIAPLLLSLQLISPALAAEPLWQALDYTPAPADNPLKGLVPYAGAANPDHFPHSMEFSYFPLAAVLKGPGQYDWSVIERFLDGVAGRGHQAIFRFYLEYPGKPSGLPAGLQDAGVTITRWQRASTPPRPPVDNETPDYRHPALRSALVDFIAALGQRYDGDARLGFITAGLLGLWGEWHDYPQNELFADKALQAAVMEAYAKAFRATPILLRYPAGEADPVYVANAATPFGFHDDSFAWNTLPSKPHYFVAKLQAANALEAWRSRPIGGEIRPEAGGKVFDAEPGLPALQDFAQCVAATHVSWLMDSGMFKAANPPERRARAIEQVQRMGYEFHLSQMALEATPEQLVVRVQIENRGVAPFYHAWPLQIALLDAAGKLHASTALALDLRQIQPAAPAALSELALPLAGLAPGRYRVLLRAANPLPQGLPLRFANRTQDADLTGWLSLGSFSR
jgi:hypothetical protein